MENSTITINGVNYVREDLVTPVLAENDEKMPFVIIRTYSAGVHMGYLKKKESTLAGMEVELVNSRRLYKWAGALTISELAYYGTSNPENCQFTVAIPSIQLVAIEIVPTTIKAAESLQGVPVWKL